MELFSELKVLIAKIDKNSIPQERRNVLQPLVDYVQSKASSGDPVRLNFICTHNSRRSHLSQVWAQAMAHHFNLQNVRCYSGGTESTALFPAVADTLRNAGFKVSAISEVPNPVYVIRYSDNEHPIIGFSKKYDDGFNPQSEFAAVMTCSHADGACPFIAGAEKRIPVTYLDPKASDNTPQQAEKYSERSLQIATEMCYVFSQINQ